MSPSSVQAPLRVHVATAVAAAIALSAWLFRLRLGLRSIAEFQGGDAPGAAFAFAAQHAWQDALFAVLCGAAAWPLARLLRDRPRPIQVGGAAPWLLVLLVFGAAWQTHIRLSFSLHVGLTWPLVVEAFDSGTLPALTLQAQPEDLAWVSAPVLVLLPLLALSGRWPRTLQGIASILLTLLTVAALAVPDPPGSQLSPESHVSPIWLLASTWSPQSPVDDVAVAPLAPPSPAPTVAPIAAPCATPAQAASPTEVEQEAAGGLRPAGQGFAPPLVPLRPLHDAKPLNVVWIIMESTGTRYFEGETYKGVLPMPFLHDLSTRGWYLSHHRSPSNSSATSIFAQFSGLWPLPTTRMFSIQKDNAIPSLFSFLGASYDRFLVTPGKLTYFFPKAFLQHSGLTEMYGFDEVPVTRNPGGEGLSKDEPEVVGFFLERLRRARPPFAAVYYSYVAHWEYTDYGPKYRHFHGSRLIDHYHDNLWLLDLQIKRIVEQLQADNRLDSTILVIAGDHGEAFGQHAENWAHARGSFEENFQTPAILVAPGIFDPKVVTWNTSHVDLLPTVLDALGLPFEARLLQGESLLRGEPKRKSLFFWGNEGTVSSIASGIKVILGGEQRCAAFDLQQDARESKRLSCEHVAPQLLALRQWRDFQRSSLAAYNEAANAGTAWQGLAQPSKPTNKPRDTATWQPPAL